MKKEGNLKKVILKNKKITFILAIALILITLAALLSSIFGNFSSTRLHVNNKKIFDISDLTINNLKFGSTEEEVRNEFGEPKEVTKDLKNNYEYKIYKYDGLTLTLKENYNDFILVKTEVTSNKYKVSRNIRVKSKISSAVKKYRISISKGNYIYKNYNIEALNERVIDDNIYLAIRNTKKVVYYNRDAVVDGVKNNTAILEFDYKFGKITKIIWSYDN